MNSNHHIPVSSKYSPSPICSPENSPELQNLSDRIQVNFSDIFTKNITPQMAELLGRLPMFDELVSRKYRIFSNIIYHFITSRGYTIAQSTQNNQRKYNEAVNTFIKR